MRILHYLDPFYSESYGHYRRLASNIALACSEYGYAFRHYVNQVSIPADITGQKIRWFRHTKREVDLLRGRKYRFLADLYALCTQLINTQQHPGSVAFLYTADLGQVYAILAACLFNANSLIRFRVCFFYDRPRRHFNRIRKLYFSLLAQIAGKLNVRLYYDETGNEDKGLHYPRSIPALNAPLFDSCIPSRINKPIRRRLCIITGSANKWGLSDVGGFLAFSRGNPLAHVDVIFKNVSDMVDVFAEYVEDGTGRVCVHEGYLADSDYASILNGADMAIIPYDPCVYRNQGSGILLEALAAGCYIISPSSSWMSSLCTRLGTGSAYRFGDAEDLLDKIIDAYKLLLGPSSHSVLLPSELLGRYTVKAFAKQVLC